MNLRFYKYHGTGNDFILIDTRLEENALPDGRTIEKLCHRRFGIGADGFIAVTDASGYDFGMTYFNSDGKESTMCGNGGRCAVALADLLSPGNAPYHFLAADGAHSGIVTARNGNISHVRLKMQDIKEYTFHDNDLIINTGSPQLVRFTGKEADIFTEGRAIRYQERFQPGGINVNFVSKEKDNIFVRTYERGVENETLSCGTGVTAAALSHALQNDMTEGNIPVGTRGGQLRVYFRREGNGFSDIWLEGPAEKVFEGSVNI